MNNIEKMMMQDHRCPECGALLNEQNSCGNCGHEEEPDFGSGPIPSIVGVAALHGQDSVLLDEPCAA